MRIGKGDVICGLPALDARRLARRWAGGGAHPAFVGHVLGIDEAAAEKVIDTFVAEGFAERTYEGRMISLTVKGNALAAATAARPVSRKTAENALDGFLSRCEIVNAEANYLYRVRKAAVFGSYARGATELGDVDVYLVLERKESDADKHGALEMAKVREAEAGGRSFGGYSDRSMFCYNQVLLFLKSRKRTLSLSVTDKWVLEDPTTLVVFDADAGGRVVPSPSPERDSADG